MARFLALRRAAAATVGVGVCAWCTDVLVNDEFDSAVTDRFRRRLSAEEKAAKPRPRIVVLGTGWGGLSFVRKLHSDQFDVREIHTTSSPQHAFLTHAVASPHKLRLYAGNACQPEELFPLHASTS